MLAPGFQSPDRKYTEDRTRVNIRGMNTQSDPGWPVRSQWGHPLLESLKGGTVCYSFGSIILSMVPRVDNIVVLEAEVASIILDRLPGGREQASKSQPTHYLDESDSFHPLEVSWALFDREQKAPPACQPLSPRSHTLERSLQSRQAFTFDSIDCDRTICSRSGIKSGIKIQDQAML